MALSSLTLAAACSYAPEPPAEPAEVAALAAQYARPSASLEGATTAMVWNQMESTRAVLQALSGLRFMRDIVSDATSATSDSSDLDLDVQGTALAHAPCPGWGNEPESARGYIEVTIGVEESQVQRAFAGHATDCKFVTIRGDVRSNVIATMDLQIDLGDDVELGESTDALLVRAAQVTGTIDGLPLGLGRQVFSFRLGEDDAIETLIDLEPMQLGLSGTLLLVLRTDGVWALKTRTGEWTCGSGSGPCALDQAA